MAGAGLREVGHSGRTERALHCPIPWPCPWPRWLGACEARPGVTCPLLSRAPQIQPQSPWGRLFHPQTRLSWHSPVTLSYCDCSLSAPGHVVNAGRHGDSAVSGSPCKFPSAEGPHRCPPGQSSPFRWLSDTELKPTTTCKSHPHPTKGQRPTRGCSSSGTPV